MSADDTPATAEQSPSKAKSMLPFILALALGLGVGGASGAFVVGPAMAKGISPQIVARKHAAEDESADSSDEATADDEAAANESGGKAGDAAAKQVYTLDNLVLNPAESGGTRFLLLSVAFETADSKLIDDMKARDAELRDAVLVALGAKTVEQLANMQARDGLKTELQNVALQLISKKSKKKTLRVYFPQFVIQ